MEDGGGQCVGLHSWGGDPALQQAQRAGVAVPTHPPTPGAQAFHKRTDCVCTEGEVQGCLWKVELAENSTWEERWIDWGYRLNCRLVRDNLRHRSQELFFQRSQIWLD